MNSFQLQNQRGKEVEDIVKAHMIQRGHRVQDVSQERQYQNIDIDFIVSDESTQNSTTLEVKRDDNINRTGNFFFEVGAQKEDYYSQGWLKKSMAQYICFYDTQKQHGYIIDYPALKKSLVAIGRKLSYWDKLDKAVKDALLVPVGKVRKLGFIVHEWGGSEL